MRGLVSRGLHGVTSFPWPFSLNIEALRLTMCLCDVYFGEVLVCLAGIVREKSVKGLFISLVSIFIHTHKTAQVSGSALFIIGCTAVHLLAITAYCFSHYYFSF